MNDAEELREVATLVRETANQATPGPWTAQEVPDGAYVEIMAGTEIAVAHAVSEHPAAPGAAAEAAWITLANPILGEQLADLFDACADEIDNAFSEAELIGYGGPGRYMNGAALVDKALAIARAIRPSVEQATRATSPGGSR